MVHGLKGCPISSICTIGLVAGIEPSSTCRRSGRARHGGFDKGGWVFDPCYRRYYCLVPLLIMERPYRPDGRNLDQDLKTDGLSGLNL